MPIVHNKLLFSASQVTTSLTHTNTFTVLSYAHHTDTCLFAHLSTVGH